MIQKINQEKTGNIRRVLAQEILYNTRKELDRFFCSVEIFTTIDGRVYNMQMGNSWVAPNRLYRDLKKYKEVQQVKITILNSPGNNDENLVLS